MISSSSPILCWRTWRLKFATLAELKAAYREVKARGGPIRFVLNHGVSLSFYFDDPEDHNIDIYWSAPMDARAREQLAVSRQYAQPIDLDLPEEDLLR